MNGVKLDYHFKSQFPDVGKSHNHVRMWLKGTREQSVCSFVFRAKNIGRKQRIYLMENNCMILNDKTEQKSI